METSTPDSWSMPQRQSPAAIFILLLKTSIAMIKALWPVLLVYFFRKEPDENSKFLWIALGFALVALIGTIIKYFFYKFHISGEHFIIQSGWLKKKTLSLPLKNILSVHLEQNVWQQFLKVAKLTLDSGGSEKVEVKIDALPVKKAEALKHVLLLKRSAETEAAAEENIRVYQLSTVELFKLSISANHLEAFVILFSVGINLMDDVRKAFNIDGWQVMGDLAGRYAEQKIFAISIIVILVAILSLFVSMIRTAIKYFDFSLMETTRAWKISYGLLNRVQKVVPFNKIQLLTWNTTWLRRRFDYWILRIHSIGFDDTNKKQHISLPVTSLEMVKMLSKHYMQSPVIEEGVGNKISEAYWRRRTVTFALPFNLVLTSIVCAFSGVVGLFTLLVFPYMAFYYYSWRKKFTWSWNNEGIQMIRGVWGKKYSQLIWNNVQQVEIRQSYFQRKRDLVTLYFHTAGGVIRLPFIKKDIAGEVSDNVIYFVERSDWGAGFVLADI